MATACFSLTSAANGSMAAAVAARADAGRQVARLYAGGVSVSSSVVSREVKFLSVAPSFPFGCGTIFSKTAPRKAMVAVGALDLESGYGFSKEPGFGSETDSGFGSRGALDFDGDANLGSDEDKDLGFGDNRSFGRDFSGGDVQNSVAPGNKLYVGNLPWSCDSQQLADIFQDAGIVDVVEVIYDKDTGRSRGFGFVTMASAEDAETAISKLDGYQLGGRPIRVNFPLSSKGGGAFRSPGGFSSRNEPGASDNSSKVFVGNLPWGVDDVTLEGLFNVHGSIVEARVIYDRDTGRSRGFGFVTFSSPNEANQAVSVLNGSNYEGRPLRVNIAGDRPAMRF